MPAVLKAVLLLAISNSFMTYAWYGHLRDLAHRPWYVAALIAWGVAFFFPTLAGNATTRVALPELLGLTIDPKEVALVGPCLGVFGDFAAAP